ncbi:MAG TPA: rRNA maturation RNase YbeY [Humisphaera sp.]
MPNRRPAAFDLTVTAESATGRPFMPFLRKHLRAAHAILKPALREFSVALVGDATMSRLHVQFMNVAGPTDVLTFPLDEDARGRVTAGEVVVCVPEARRRSKAEGTDVRREVLLYALHGMLHLCGYDDTTPAEFARMHRAEDRILTRLGVGPVFAAAAGSGRKTGAGKVGETGTPGRIGNRGAAARGSTGVQSPPAMQRTKPGTAARRRGPAAARRPAR